MKKTLIPMNCHECENWAVFEITPMPTGAYFECTNCKHKYFMQQSKNDINNLIKTMKIMCASYPELGNLKNPGDHTKFSKKDLK